MQFWTLLKFWLRILKYDSMTHKPQSSSDFRSGWFWAEVQGSVLREFTVLVVSCCFDQVTYIMVPPCYNLLCHPPIHSFNRQKHLSMTLTHLSSENLEAHRLRRQGQRAAPTGACCAPSVLLGYWFSEPLYVSDMAVMVTMTVTSWSTS